MHLQTEYLKNLLYNYSQYKYLKTYFIHNNENFTYTSFATSSFCSLYGKYNLIGELRYKM